MITPDEQENIVRILYLLEGTGKKLSIVDVYDIANSVAGSTIFQRSVVLDYMKEYLARGWCKFRLDALIKQYIEYKLEIKAGMNNYTFDMWQEIMREEENQ